MLSRNASTATATTITRRNNLSAVSAPPSTKFFINNNNSLSISGEKVKIGIQERKERKSSNLISIRKCIALNPTASTTFSSCYSETVEDTFSPKNNSIATEKNTKKFVQLKSNLILGENNSERTTITNHQVRKIRETFEIEDFERLLISLTCNNNNNNSSKKKLLVHNINNCKQYDKKLKHLYATTRNIYEDFFECHYKVLHDLINN